MVSSRLYRAGCLIILALALAMLPVGRARGQSGERCFSETGFCIAGRIRAFWEQNGGLPVFGFPIGKLQQQTIEGRAIQAQWFERARLELHPENRPPYDVLLGRLGAEALERSRRNWMTFPRARPTAPHYFAATGHAIAPEFWGYWSSHGLELDRNPGKSFAESLALFGMPLSEAAPEANSADGRSYLTQWFERARFEYHPENANTPYVVLLGLLGRELHGATPPAPPSGVARIAPIVDADTGLLLGGAQANRWLDAGTTAAHLQGGERYRLYTIAGAAGSASGSKPVALRPPACTGQWTVQLTPAIQHPNALAIGGEWNALPRAPVELPTTSPEYRRAIREWLQTQGIAEPEVRLTKVLRVDLEGDGVDEVLIGASYFGGGAPSGAPLRDAGDYSLVVLRKLIDGQVVTLPVAANYFPQSSAGTQAGVEYTLVATLDLNGDGQLEIVVDNLGWEWGGIGVYEVQRTSVEKLLMAGCGV